MPATGADPRPFSFFTTMSMRGLGYPDERALVPRKIEPVSTSVTVFMGRASSGPVCLPVPVCSMDEAELAFGPVDASIPLYGSLNDFFRNGGRHAIVIRLYRGLGLEADSPEGDPGPALTAEDYLGSHDSGGGMFPLASGPFYNLLCIPPDQYDLDVAPEVWQTAARRCYEDQAILLMDAPAGWDSAQAAEAGVGSLGISGMPARNTALYFPQVIHPDRTRQNRLSAYSPGGSVAGIMSRIDSVWGPWHAPAGMEATVKGASGLAVTIQDRQMGILGPMGINCLRDIPSVGIMIWGSRTLASMEDASHPERYLNIRRTVLFIQSSLRHSLGWVAFEPVRDALWSKVRLITENFLYLLFQRGAFSGRTPSECYFVRCDRSTHTEKDMEEGLVHLQIGIAMLRPGDYTICSLELQGGRLYY